MNILLIDNDISFVKVLADFLKQEHKLRITSNNLDALNIFKASHFDVVIISIYMLKMGGEGLLEIIRKENKHTRVIVFTDAMNEKYKIEAERLGVYAYFTKQLDIQQFMETLLHIENEINHIKTIDY